MTALDAPGGSRTPFVHAALLYRDRDELAAEASRFVREALATEGSVLAVLTPASAALLEESLGPEARQVRFGDARAYYARMGPMLQGFARHLGEAAAAGRRPVRVLAENPFPERRTREYLRCESMTNVGFAPFEASVMCMYDASRTAESLLASVRRTHPELIEEGAAVRSREFTDPLVFMSQSDRELRHAEAPAGAPRQRLASAADLSGLRRFVGRYAAAAGLPADAVEDLQLAASEIASNVIVHTPGPGEVRLWTEGHDLVCEVSDDGPGIDDPFAGYRLAPEDRGSARGLWLARQICDEVTVKSEPGNTVVRMHMELARVNGSLRR
jgi:anti-sigma regulatory factor (Ser/Thr protein kinase)